jgi:hypothetical protein
MGTTGMGKRKLHKLNDAYLWDHLNYSMCGIVAPIDRFALNSRKVTCKNCLRILNKGKGKGK